MGGEKNIQLFFTMLKKKFDLNFKSKKTENFLFKTMINAKNL